MIKWFNVGDRVSSMIHGKGNVIKYTLSYDEYLYEVKWDNGNISAERYCMIKTCE